MIDDFRPTRPLKPTEPPKPTPSQDTTIAPVEPFITPDQASQRSLAAPTILPPEPEEPEQIPSEPESETPARGTGHHWFNLPWPPNKQEIILACVVLAMAI